jgi:hypothetical protein
MSNNTWLEAHLKKEVDLEPVPKNNLLRDQECLKIIHLVLKFNNSRLIQMSNNRISEWSNSTRKRL